MACGNFKKYHDPSALKLLDEPAPSGQADLQVEENGHIPEEANR
jgi:hypothetical protein